MTEKEKNVKSMVMLGDIASVTVGQILTRVISKSDDGKVVPVLQTKAVTAGIINKEDLGQAVLSKDVDEDKYTREGDIVIKLSTPYDAAYVTADMAGLVIPSFCAAIRVTKKDMIDAKYLSAFLNTGYVKEQLLSKVVGSAKPMIKISDIRELNVPTGLDGDMKDIGEAYMLSGKKRLLLSEMIRTEEKLMENIVLASVKEVADHE